MSSDELIELAGCIFSEIMTRLDSQSEPNTPEEKRVPFKIPVNADRRPTEAPGVPKADRRPTEAPGEGEEKKRDRFSEPPVSDMGQSSAVTKAFEAKKAVGPLSYSRVVSIPSEEKEVVAIPSVEGEEKKRDRFSEPPVSDMDQSSAVTKAFEAKKADVAEDEDVVSIPSEEKKRVRFSEPPVSDMDQSSAVTKAFEAKKADVAEDEGVVVHCRSKEEDEYDMAWVDDSGYLSKVYKLIGGEHNGDRIQLRLNYLGKQLKTIHTDIFVETVEGNIITKIHVSINDIIQALSFKKRYANKPCFIRNHYIYNDFLYYGITLVIPPKKTLG
jgi:hypothetical protein